MAGSEIFLEKMASVHRMDTDILRSITVPQAVVERAAHGPIEGACLEFAVEVNWPELRLTEEQVVANAVARAYGQREPYPDRSIFTVVVPYARLDALSEWSEP